MGRRGPPRKPDSRHNAKAVTSPAALPVASEHDISSLTLARVPDPPLRMLHEDHLVEAWRRFASLALRLGRLTEADLPALELLVETWSEYRAAADIADDPDNAYCMSEKGGMYCHPAVFRKQAALKALRDLMARFGMTPMDRVTLGVVISSGSRKTGLAEFAAARDAPRAPQVSPETKTTRSKPRKATKERRK